MVKTVVLKNFDFASHTDRGKVRDRNEDFLSYFDTINGHVFVVCDGMGGHSAGNIASELAVESVGKFFSDRYHANPFEAIEMALVFANRVVYDHAVGNDYLLGMGTTAVLVLIRDDRVYYGHAGDSRLYLYHDQVLDQVTKDHSYVQKLIDRGEITKKQAQEHHRKNEITCAIGLSSKFEPEVSPRALIPQDGNTLLICTDGLTNLVPDDEIVKVLEAPHNLNEMATKLIGKANKLGGLDNISVQIIKFHNLGFDHEPEEDENRPVFEYLRGLLKKKGLMYALVLFFVLGMSFFAGMYEHPQMVTDYKSKPVEYDANSGLIIPYRLMEGDNIEILANKFNTTQGTLLGLNPNYDNTKPGMHIKIPVRLLHIVQQTDELPLIVEIYECSMIDIMKANDLCSQNLDVGSELIIPLQREK